MDGWRQSTAPPPAGAWTYAGYAAVRTNATSSALALDGAAAGVPEVVADEISRNVRSGLSADLTALYPQLAASAS